MTEPKQLQISGWDGEPSSCKSHPPTGFRIQLPDGTARLRIGRVGGSDDLWICEMCGGFLMREDDGFRAMMRDDYAQFLREIAHKLDENGR